MTHRLWIAVVVIASVFILATCQSTPASEPAAPLPQEVADAETPIGCWYPNGTWRTWDECVGVPVTPTPTSTPTHTPSPAPSRTPTPTLTPTPSATPVPEATPTQENTPLPTPPPGSDKRCTLRMDQGGIRIRSAPDTTTGEVVGSLELGAEVEFDQFQYGGPYLWGHHARGWSAILIWATDEWWVAGTQEGELCQDVEGWPEDREPPPPFAWEPPANPRGVHLLPGANCSLLFNNISGRFGTIKGISSTDQCMRIIHQFFPDLMLVWRNWVRAGYGPGDGPPSWGQGDPVAVANAWFDAEYATWVNLGLIEQDRSQYTEDVIDFFEYRNELGFVGEWEIQFDIQMMRRANAVKVCLGIFSDGYGNPTIVQFNMRTPVLDYMVAHPCQPGKRHIIADHSYSRYDSGPWLFGRWKLQMDTLRGIHGPKYDVLFWMFTEFGVPNTQGEYDGRGVPNCPRALDELDIVDGIFADAREVAGYHIFAMGSPGWLDYTPCLGDNPSFGLYVYQKQS